MHKLLPILAATAILVIGPFTQAQANSDMAACLRAEGVEVPEDGQFALDPDNPEHRAAIEKCSGGDSGLSDSRSAPANSSGGKPNPPPPLAVQERQSPLPPGGTNTPGSSDPKNQPSGQPPTGSPSLSAPGKPTGITEAGSASAGTSGSGPRSAHPQNTELIGTQTGTLPHTGGSNRTPVLALGLLALAATPWAVRKWHPNSGTAARK